MRDFRPAVKRSGRRYKHTNAQHRFTRMITGISKLSYTVKDLKRLGLWSSDERRNTADLIEVCLFKVVKGLSGIPMESMFELSTTKHLRGYQLKLTKDRSNLEVRRHFFT